MKAYLSLAFSKQVVTTALKIALFVGILLACINHYPFILSGSLTQQQFFQIFLTFLVPYCVSTHSSVKAILNHQDKSS